MEILLAIVICQDLILDCSLSPVWRIQYFYYEVIPNLFVITLKESCPKFSGGIRPGIGDTYLYLLVISSAPCKLSYPGLIGLNLVCR